jgi:hypothetical protein
MMVCGTGINRWRLFVDGGGVPNVDDRYKAPGYAACKRGVPPHLSDQAVVLGDSE